MEKGYCYEGAFGPLDESMATSGVEQRDCYSGVFENPFSAMDSKEFLLDRQRNLFRVAMYYKPDQNVITLITRSARMSVSDKLSWIGGMAGLFTGFSVISGFEIVYWLTFKVLLHKKDVKVEPLDHESNDINGLREEIKELREMLYLKINQKNGEEERIAIAFDAVFNTALSGPKKRKISPSSCIEKIL